MNQGTKKTSAPTATANTSSAREIAICAMPRVAAVDVRRVVDFAKCEASVANAPAAARPIRPAVELDGTADSMSRAPATGRSSVWIRFQRWSTIGILSATNSARKRMMLAVSTGWLARKSAAGPGNS